MVGIPVLEVECTNLSFVRVSSQVVGRVVWDESGQGITEGLLQLHERLVLGGDAEIVGVEEAPGVWMDWLIIRVHIKEHVYMYNIGMYICVVSQWSLQGLVM